MVIRLLEAGNITPNNKKLLGRSNQPQFENLNFLDLELKPITVNLEPLEIGKLEPIEVQLKYDTEE